MRNDKTDLRPAEKKEARMVFKGLLCTFSAALAILRYSMTRRRCLIIGNLVQTEQNKRLGASHLLLCSNKANS